MDNKDLELIGNAIIGLFFGAYNVESLEDSERYLGMFIVRHGGVEKVYNELYQHTEPTEEQKQEILKVLNECVQKYQDASPSPSVSPKE